MKYYFESARRTNRRTYSALEFDNRTDFERMSEWWHKVARPWIERQKKCAEYAWLFKCYANLLCYAYILFVLSIIVFFFLAGIVAGGLAILRTCGEFLNSHTDAQLLELLLRIMIIGAGLGVLLALGDRKVRLGCLAVSAVVALLLMGPAGPSVMEWIKEAVEWVKDPSWRDIASAVEYLWEVLKEWVTAPLK